MTRLKQLMTNSDNFDDIHRLLIDKIANLKDEFLLNNRSEIERILQDSQFENHDAFNNFLRHNLTLDGIRFLKKAYSKRKYTVRVGVKKIEVRPETLEQLKNLKPMFGDSFDTVIQALIESYTENQNNVDNQFKTTIK